MSSRLNQTLDTAPMNAAREVILGTPAAKLLASIAIWATSFLLSSEDLRSAPLEICVRNFSKIEIGDVEVDSILSRANGMLHAAGTNSPQCGTLSVNRKGSTVSFFDEFPRSIATEADYQKIVTDPCVKVVERITWCGARSITGGFLGCAPISGTGIAVVRKVPLGDAAFNSGVEPVTWLHELGHNRGLEHNDTDTLSIMASGIGPENKAISPSECSVFVTGKPLPYRVADAATPLPAGAEGAASTNPQSVLPIEDFVKRPYSKFPTDEAKNYQNDLKKVEAMLSDPAYSLYQGNVIAVIAVIGTPDTLPLLERIIKTPVTGENWEKDIHARLAATIAIGTIAGRFNLPDERLATLKEARDQNFWEGKLEPANGRLSDQSTQGARRLSDDDIQSASRDLAIQSYLGYAITGSEAAHAELKRESSGAATAALPEPQRQERKIIIDEAIATNRASSIKGPLSVFQLK